MNRIPPMAPLTDSPLIIHLGLPKTGTRSLQEDIFPRVRSHAFIGALAPRDQVEQSPEFTAIRRFVMDDKGSLQSMQATLDDMIAQHGPLLLSEECFLIGAMASGVPRWEERIERVHQLSAHLQPEIWVTLRPWRAGVQSYFLQLAKHTLKREAPGPVWWLRESNAFGIWRAPELSSSLRALNLPIRFIPFEAIKTGQFNRKVLGLETKMSHRNRTHTKGSLLTKTHRVGVLETFSELPVLRPASYFLNGIRHHVGDIRWTKTFQMQPWDDSIWSAVNDIEQAWESFRNQVFDW